MKNAKKPFFFVSTVLFFWQFSFIIRYKLLYSSDGSFRFFNDVLSNQHWDFSLNPVSYFTNRIWIDNFRQFLLAIAQIPAWNFQSLILFNSVIQLVGLCALYVMLFKIGSQSLSHSQLLILFSPLLILFPVLALYLDAHIIWGYPLYATHFLLLLNAPITNRRKILFVLLTLMLTGTHEYTIPYFILYLTAATFLFYRDKHKRRQIIYSSSLTFVAFSTALVNFIMHKSDYSTLNQLQFLGVANITKLQFSSYTFSFILFLIAVIAFNYNKDKKTFSFCFILSLGLLTMSYYLTSNWRHSNFWISYLMRNDFTLFFTISLILLALSKLKNVPSKQISGGGVLIFILLFQFFGTAMLANYGKSYNDCWSNTLSFADANGFVSVEKVSKFGECQVDWVAPMTSLIMNKSGRPKYLVINKATLRNSEDSAEGSIKIASNEDAISLAYGQTLKDDFLKLDLSILIKNLIKLKNSGHGV